MERIPIGLSGFDEHINGGLIPKSITLLYGGTGTGKTIFSLQYLYQGAKKYKQKGLYISLEQKEEDLKADVEGFSMNFEELKEYVRFVYIPPYLIKDFVSILHRELESFKPVRVIIDSLSVLELSMEDNFQRKKESFKINELLKTSGCTTIMTSETVSDGGIFTESRSQYSRFDIEGFLSDTIIALYYAGIGGEGDRAVRIIKMRRSSHTRGPIPMTIDDEGMKILKSSM